MSHNYFVSLNEPNASKMIKLGILYTNWLQRQTLKWEVLEMGVIWISTQPCLPLSTLHDSFKYSSSLACLVSLGPIFIFHMTEIYRLMILWSDVLSWSYFVQKLRKAMLILIYECGNVYRTMSALVCTKNILFPSLPFFNILFPWCMKVTVCMSMEKEFSVFQLHYHHLFSQEWTTKRQEYVKNMPNHHPIVWWLYP